jgi:hypothetical protein
MLQYLLLVTFQSAIVLLFVSALVWAEGSGVMGRQMGMAY